VAAETSAAESQQELMSRWVRSWVSAPPKTKESSDRLEQELLHKPMGDSARGRQLDLSVEPSFVSEKQPSMGVEPSAAARPPQEPTQEVFVGRKPKKVPKPQRK